MKKLLFATATCVALSVAADVTVGLETLDLRSMTSGWNIPVANKGNGGTPLKIARTTFARGVGTHAPSSYFLTVNGKLRSFRAVVGADTGIPEAKMGSVRFRVLADNEVVAQSPVMRFGAEPYALTADLRGAKTVELVVDTAGDGCVNDLGNWCDADFVFEDGTNPAKALVPFVPDAELEQFGILTPKAGPEPRINPPRVLGARPGHQIVFTVPVSGERPMTIAAEGLPDGLSLDAHTGVLTGSVAARGEYPVHFVATNSKGVDRRLFTLKIGDRIALTPPMGWNSWNCFASAVTAKDIRDTADAFVRERLVDYGWSYVNIDDYWQNHQGAPDASTDIKGPMRHADGTVVVNRRFGDMKALADYVHAKGLKIGLYSSPGPLTCGKCTGSWGFEDVDARTYADWGFDYLKYDWCSYTDVAVGDRDTPMWYQAPYLKMGRHLAVQDRDIVFSMCQYGMDRVSQWGEAVGGQCWRTTGDITDTWDSLYGIVEMQAGLEHFSGPGAWNDPDMLIVGWVGWGPRLHPTRLTPNEQYAHITWWSLFAAPMLIGCDLTKLDDLTRALLMNPEVIEVNQDPLGKAAARIVFRPHTLNGEEVWARPLADGSIALGIFNVGRKKHETVIDFNALGVHGQWQVRDLWRRMDEKPVQGIYRVTLPSHAAHFIRLKPGRDGRLATGMRDVRELAWRQLFRDDRDKKATFERCANCPKIK